MTTPIIYRTRDLVTTSIGQSSEAFSELLEEIPYPEGVSSEGLTPWPPAGFTAPGSDVVAQDTNISSQLPTSHDLEWLQGDSPSFSWYFTDVIWTTEDPEIGDEDAPAWVETVWAAQVRNPYIMSTYGADYWVPAYGFQYNWWLANSKVADFVVTTEVVEMNDSNGDPIVPTQWATKVTIGLSGDSSAAILPGSWYRWDLQVRQTNPVEDDPDIVRTWLRGRARIVTEWTVA